MGSPYRSQVSVAEAKFATSRESEDLANRLGSPAAWSAAWHPRRGGGGPHSIVRRGPSTLDTAAPQAGPACQDAYDPGAVARVLLPHLPEIVFATAQGDRVVYTNRAAQDLLGRIGRLAPSDGVPLGQLLGLAESKEVAQCLSGEVDKASVQWHCTGPAGVRILQSILVRMPESDGTAGLLAIGTDQTEARRREEEDRRQERLAALGQLAAGAAHEIRNPLTAIRGFLQLMEQRPRPEVQQKYLGIMRREIDRIERITADLLLLARPWRSEQVCCDLALCVSKVADVVRGRADAFGIDITVRASSEIPLVFADPSRLEQVFLNLLVNAVEAMSRPGCIEAEVRPVTGGFVEAVIRDQGPGIPAQVLPRLFEPFYTTKAGGTGLGLAVSDSIVRAYGGHIAVSSPPGGGAVFMVRLPIADRPALL